MCKGGSETYRLRHKEQDTLTACLNLLISLENAGKIVHCDRLNSGKIFVPYMRKSGRRGGRMIRLCREGTPDGYFILNTGKVIWLEAKRGKAKQRYEQERFEAKISKLPNHEYWLIRDIDEFIVKLKDLLGDF